MDTDLCPEHGPHQLDYCPGCEQRSRALATILCALRRFQDPAHGNYIEEHFDEAEPLTKKQIDRLCEDLNMGSLVLAPKSLVDNATELANIISGSDVLTDAEEKCASVDRAGELAQLVSRPYTA